VVTATLGVLLENPARSKRVNNAYIQHPSP